VPHFKNTKTPSIGQTELDLKLDSREETIPSKPVLLKLGQKGLIGTDSHLICLLLLQHGSDQTIWEKANPSDKGPEWLISKIFRGNCSETVWRKSTQKRGKLVKTQMESLVLAL
jgi:hypothetical protein